MDNADFSDEDIYRVKKTWAGQFSRSLENPQTIADFAYSIERYQLPKDYFTTFLQRLDKVTKEEIIAAAKKYFHPENAYILVVTDRSMKPQIAKLASNGEVLELDSEGKRRSESSCRCYPGKNRCRLPESFGWKRQSKRHQRHDRGI